MTSHKIDRLSEETASYIRTSVVLPSLPSVLIELVQNALDAQATRIAVVVDITLLLIKCSDNGSGIAPADMTYIGQRYVTSKNTFGIGGDCQGGIDTFGFRGEALGSMADAGVLEVESRVGMGPTWKLQLKNGTKLYEGQSSIQRLYQGTTVTVRDLFYKWPVRRKALLATPQSTLILSLKNTFMTLTLLHPHVAFTLEDASSMNTDLKRLVSVQKAGEGVLGRWKQLWGPTGVSSVVPVNDHNDPFRMEGFISIEASPSKIAQHLFVNTRSLPANAPLLKHVNLLFAASSFSRHANDSFSFVNPTAFPKTSKSPKKTSTKYPVFALHLILPSEMIDVTLEPGKRIILFLEEKRVFEYVSSIIQTFLKGQGFLASPSPAPSPESHQDQSIEQSKGSNLEGFTDSILNGAPPVKPELAEASTLTIPGESGEPFEWRDPKTNVLFLIDPRTGYSWRPNDSSSMNVEKIPLQRLKRRLEDIRDSKEPVPDWLMHNCQELQGSLFTRSKHIIPSLGEPAIKNSSASNPPNHFVQRTAELQKIEGYFDSNEFSTIDNQGLTREDLRNSIFISQVENKFILVKVELITGSLLVMIDQHAASERVRVEKYYKQMCGPVKVFAFQEPILVLVTPQEADLIAENQEEFASWGIKLTMEKEEQIEQDTSLFHTVKVETVPFLISDRLRTEGDLLERLIRGFVIELSARPRTQFCRENGDWLVHIANCPKVLVELINSKACRGAIMFNDVLSEAECKDLVAQLVECRIPFQCAHGRPSLIPIVQLSTSRQTDKTGSHAEWKKFFAE